VVLLHDLSFASLIREAMRPLIAGRDQVKTPAFTGVSTWCAIADVKITLPDDPEADVKEIRELLDDCVKKEASG